VLLVRAADRSVEALRRIGYTRVCTPMESRTTVGGAVEALFFAGRYHDVLAATVDTPAGTSPDDLPFAVGALAFSGRLVEAELLSPRVRRGAPARAVAACAFSLAVALARAGRSADAVARLRAALRPTDGRRDAHARAFLLQASACVRYFTGRLPRAAADAERALGCALRAGFPYVAMLANDLRGHALAQGGDSALGGAVLLQARDQARRLGYVANAHAIELAITLYRARDAAPREAAALLTEAAALDVTQDSYSRRTLRLELATLLAWMGRAAEARSLIEDAAPQCAGEPRLGALLCLARAHVARVSEGWEATARALDEADRKLDDAGDAAQRVEAAALRLALARAAGAPTDPHAARLRALHLATGVARARAWLDAYGAGGGDPRAMPPTLAAIAHGSSVSLLRAGLLGLVPESVGLAPGRRLHRFSDALLVEDRGDFEALPALAPRAAALLDALAADVRARPDLLRAVWGLRTYDPERHDTVVKTAVSRLRASLGAHARWVTAGDGGYGLAEGVSVRHHDVTGPPLPTLPGARPPPSDAGHNERQRRILDVVTRAGRATAGELSLRLREPLRTVSRELSAMCDAALLRREGAGRATSYRLPEVNDDA